MKKKSAYSLLVVVSLMLNLLGGALPPVPAALAAVNITESFINSAAPLAPAATQTIGGTAASGNLRISVLDTGQMQVEMYVNGVWKNNWFGGTAVGSRLQSTEGGGYTLGYFTPGTAATLVSNTGGAAGTGSITTTWTAGSLTIVQTTSYTDSNRYFAVTWTLTNNGSALNDLRFFHGGDTLLYGSDSGQGWWRAADNSVGVTHPTNGQQMWLQGITAPAHYNSTLYSTVRTNGNNGLLTDIATATTHDNGLALQWNNAALAPSATWTIQMEEHLTMPNLDFALTVNKAGTGQGGVIAAYGSGTVLLPGTAQLPAQITNIAPGTVITLTAVPSTTSVFAGWSGAVSGAANPVTVTMDADKTVTATFDLSADLSVTENVLRMANAITYTIVARNIGPGAANGAVVSSTFPAEVISVTWACVAAGGGAVCGGSGTGNVLADTLTTFPASDVVTYTVRGTLGLLDLGNNVVTVTPPSGVVDPDLLNNRAEYQVYRLLLPLVFKN